MSNIGGQRRDAMPLTWELPAAAALAWVSVAAMLLPAAQGAASWLTGAGWGWPSTAGALTANLLGLLEGHPRAALAARPMPSAPSAGVVYVLVILVEVAWVSVSLLGLRAWWRTWGPGKREGLAGRAEVEKVLGLSRMRRDRKVIRPDLYAKTSATGGRS
jgi:type IV secretion system protein VirD4